MAGADRPWQAAIAAAQARGVAVVDTGALLVALVRGEPRVAALLADLGCDAAALEQGLAACGAVEAERYEGHTLAAVEALMLCEDIALAAELALLLALVHPQVNRGAPSRADELLRRVGVAGAALRRAVLEAGGGLVLAEDAVPWARWGELQARARRPDWSAWAELAADPRLGAATMCLAYLAAGPATIAWLACGLTDDRKWGVAGLVRMAGVLHPALGLAMIDAGVREEDPSANRGFLRIGLWGCGHAAVRERLGMHLEGEDPALVEGALRALYWTTIDAGVELPIATVGRRFLREGSPALRRQLLAHLLGRSRDRFEADERAAWAEALAAARVDADEDVRRAALSGGAG